MGDIQATDGARAVLHVHTCGHLEVDYWWTIYRGEIAAKEASRCGRCRRGSGMDVLTYNPMPGYNPMPLTWVP